MARIALGNGKVFQLRPMVAAIGLIAALTIAVRPATGQQLRGTVVQTDGSTPVSGALVVLLHATRDDSVVARTVTGARGTFTLKAPVATTVRLRVLRVGYEPTNVGSYTLAANETRTVPVALAENRVTIAAFDVRAKNNCQVRPDGAQLVTQLYEQARIALISSTSTVSDASALANVVGFVRNEDKQGHLVGDIQRTAVTGPSTRPYASVSVDSLSRFGYVIAQPDGSVMYAPDADVLLSNAFLARHCLFLVNGNGADSSVIGIGFKPVSNRVNVVDVKGTLWLDRTTNELQSLDYSYEPLAAEYQTAGVGGRVEFAQTSGGWWFVSRWSIRMPRMEAENAVGVGRDFRRAMPRGPSLQGLQIAGGEVQSIRVDDHLLYSNSKAVRVGEDRADLLNLRVTSGVQAYYSPDQTDSAVAVRAAKAKAAELAVTPPSGVPINVGAPRIVPVLPTDKRQAALYVTNSIGQPIAYATVMVNGGDARTTDTTGRVLLPVGDKDSVSLMVRRVGYKPFVERIGRHSRNDVFNVELLPTAQALSVVNVLGKRDKSPLEMSGFYERMQEVKKGAVVGEFLTPEMLEMKNYSQTSQLLQGTRFAQVARSVDGKVIILGRSNCVMSIFVDGIRVHRIHGATDEGHSDPMKKYWSTVDEIVDGNAISAIEIYPSNANAPASLQPLTGNGSCGIVAIWTGGRR